MTRARHVELAVVYVTIPSAAGVNLTAADLGPALAGLTPALVHSRSGCDAYVVFSGPAQMDQATELAARVRAGRLGGADWKDIECFLSQGSAIAEFDDAGGIVRLPISGPITKVHDMHARLLRDRRGAPSAMSSSLGQFSQQEEQALSDRTILRMTGWVVCAVGQVVRSEIAIRGLQSQVRLHGADYCVVGPDSVIVYILGWMSRLRRWRFVRWARAGGFARMGIPCAAMAWRRGHFACMVDRTRRIVAAPIGDTAAIAEEAARSGLHGGAVR